MSAKAEGVDPATRKRPSASPISVEGSRAFRNDLDERASRPFDGKSASRDVQLSHAGLPVSKHRLEFHPCDFAVPIDVELLEDVPFARAACSLKQRLQLVVGGELHFELFL